jgi:hypothetical protein
MRIIASYLSLLLLFTFAYSAGAQAQTESSAIKITHTTPTAGELPYPGEELKLSAFLENTRSFDLHMRAVVVRDGVVMEIIPRESTLDSNDKPRYTFVINAPEHELSYQFVLLLPSQKTVSSNRFVLTRPCRIMPKLTDLENPALDKEDAATLALLSTGLERDIGAYDTTAKILDSIFQFFKKPADEKQ